MTTVTLEQAIQMALAHHQAGRLPQAEAIYQQILKAQPSHPDALHFLGVLAKQVGKHEIAIELIGRALAVQPDYAAAHNNLGTVLKELGRFNEAIENFHKALALNPAYAEAHNNLGTVIQSQGKTAEAEACYRKALESKPDYADAYNNLGSTLQKQGRLELAIENYRQALTLKPDYVDACINLGGALQEQGKLELAIESYRNALLLKPDCAEAHGNLGNALGLRGDLDAAAESFCRALSLKPDVAEIHSNFGNVLKEQGRLAEAVASFHQALLLKPDFVEAYNNLGLVLQEQGEFLGAVECFRKALALKPDYAEAFYNLGIAQQKQGRLAEAADSYRTALLLKPDFAEAYCNMGVVFREQGKLEQAIASYRQALTLKPDFPDAQSNLLFTLSFHVDAAPDQYLAEVLDYGRKALDSAKPYTNWPACSGNSRAKDIQPLRVGLLSGDFKTHPVGYFLENIVAHLNPRRVELLAYSTIVQEDDLTFRLKPHFSSWCSLARMDDVSAARRIREDGVHILVDLAGHTARNRLAVFAWKPAPVQVSWLGYFASTGVPGMDYLLADPVSVSEAHRGQFSETVWNLPETRLCFTPPVIAEDRMTTPLPAVRNGYITFGCFQSLSKINDGVLAVWARILRSLPQARLRIQNRQMGCPVTRAEFLQRLAQHGIESGRTLIESKVPRDEYLKAHANVDIILDTFPYPGGTTTCEALWMGVPTLTLLGSTLLARQGASLLANAGLADWIAGDADDYLNRAVAHAADIGSLAQLRSGLREQVRVSPLFDAPRFALNLENALHGMWHEKLLALPFE